MFRTPMIVVLAAVALGGCGERHRPVVRSIGEEPGNERAPAHPSPGTFHSMTSEAPTAAPSGPEVDLGPVRLMAPEGWVRKPPRVEFIRAEFALPRVDGDTADGRLTVSVAGGSVQDNVNRWRQQFAGKPEKQSQEQVKVDGIDVTLVDFSGTYMDQRGSFTPAVESPGYRMLGAILDVGGQLHFIKAYGPAKTMSARAAEFRGFVQSLKASKPAK